MILDLSEDAKEYGRQALRAFEAAGGDQLVQQAEAKPDTRDALVGPVLNELGAWELDPRTDADGLEAAAALCRSAGYWALPHPVAERLARPVDLDVDGLIVVADNQPAGAIGGVESRWTAVTLDGVRSAVVGRGVDRSGSSSPRSNCRRPTATGRVTSHSGSCCRAGRCSACSIVPSSSPSRMSACASSSGSRCRRSRVSSSSSPTPKSNAVGLEILAKYALWSIGTGKPEAIEDALALRMSAIEAAEVVFRVCHQLHGAVGFCDETTLSWLSRYSQPLRRLPLGLSATRDLLTRRVGGGGLTGLYA